MLQANTLIRTDFSSFVRKAFRHAHDGTKLGDHAYVDYLCHELQKVAENETQRLIINMPPRHLKSFVGAKCLAAWTLGREPSTHVLVVTYSETLANEIAYGIRSIMQSSWYKDVFKTRLADDRTKVTDFATTQGGRVFAASIDGSITGHGADLLIFDDPIDIDKADDLEHIKKINARFDSKVMSRLNNAKKSRVVVIAHRLNERDLSGHLKEQRGWRQISLPMIAKRSQTYDVGHGEWRRKKGDRLRPDAFGKKEIKRLEKTALAPDFETLYQQNPGGAGSLRLKRAYFAPYETAPLNMPTVLSVDPGQRGGKDNSFSTIQAWCPFGPFHALVEVWREQCNYETLRATYMRFIRKHRPVAAVIEATAMGPQLISDVAGRGQAQVVEIVPDGRSKVERLIEHLPTIRKKRVLLPEHAEWREAYLEEMLNFPNGKFDDQVDATTQYLDWIAKNRSLPTPERRGVAAGVNSMGHRVSSVSVGVTSECHGGIFQAGRRRW
jgi:predicted phage terminase large subunit-like protein